MAMTMHLWKSLKVMIVQKDDSPGKTLHHPANARDPDNEGGYNSAYSKDVQLAEARHES
jgi:hypothetical protein